MRLQAGHFLADGLQRSIELAQVSHHQEQFAQGQYACLNIANADKKNRSRPYCCGQTK